MKVPSLKTLSASELLSRLNLHSTADDLKKLLSTTIGNQYLVEKHSSLSKLALLRADSIENENYYRELLLEREVINDNQESSDEKYTTYKRRYIEREITKLLLNNPKTKTELVELVESSREFVFNLILPQVSNLDRINRFLPSFVNLSSLTLQIQHAKKVESASNLTELVRSIGMLPNLLSFALINSQINDDLLRPFVKELEKTTLNERLVELDLSYNKISTEGFRLVLAYFLDRAETILTRLDFAGNEIQAEGGRMLGRIIKVTTSLEVIDLRLNLFGDEGGKMIIEAMMKNNFLQYLNLSHNDLSSGSADAVCKLLETCKERNSKLKQLTLCGNSFTNSDLKRMDASVRSEDMNIIDTRGNDERM